MPFYTEKLHLKFIQPNDYFADESFNNILRDADDKLVGVAHLLSGAHWDVWERETSYDVNDIVRWPNLHGHQYAKCVVAGSSGTTMPNNNLTGEMVTDNTVTWEIISLSEIPDGGGSILVWLSNKFYNRGDVVYYGKSLYRCAVAHTSTIFASDVGNWQEIFSSIRPWNDGIYYAKDDTVIIEGEIYQCTNAHTSGSTFDTTEASNWSLVGVFGLVKDWESNKHYHVGQLVDYSGITCVCITEHVSSASDFSSDITRWKLFTASISPWGLSDYYPLGSVVVYGYRIWRCIYAHNRTTSVFEDTLSNWTPLGYNLPAYLRDWQPNTYYYLHQTVLRENKYLYKCTYTHTSTNVWEDDVTNWVRLGGIEGVIRDWEPNIRYYPNQLVTYLGTLYRAVALHDSDSVAFENDVNKWRRINANIGNWQQNTFYPEFHLVEYNHMIYRCLQSHTTTGLFDDTKWQPILAYPIINEWQPNTNYLENQVIKFNNMLLIAVDTHTSDSTDIINDLTTPNIHWNLVYANIQTWQASIAYKIGTQVIYNNNLYQAKDTHTSGSTFDIAHWELIGQFDAFVYDWQANKYYYANQIIIKDKELYRSDSNHTSDSTWNDDKVNWTKISSAVVIDNWASSTEYLLNEVVVWNGVLYRCNTAHTSSTTFDGTKFTPVYANIAPWQASTQYLVDQLVMYNNQLYKCITAHTSTSTFEPDGAKWQPVANNIAGIPAWASGVYYYQNQVVKYNGKIWRCLESHKAITKDEQPDVRLVYSNIPEYFRVDENTSLPATTTVDLGDIYLVSDIKTATGGAYITITGVLEGSVDNVNFTKICDFSGRETQPGASINMDSCMYARYLRFTVNTRQLAGSISFGSVQFSNLKVWGDSDKWETIVEDSIRLTYWQSNMRYDTDNIVLYDNEFYRCIEAHDSKSTFEPTKWKKIPRMVIPDWKADESYILNQVVFYDGKMYKCIVAHTSSSTFTQANWTPVNDTIDTWQAGKYYYANQVVWYNNSLWRCLVQHESDSTENPDGAEVYKATTNTMDIDDTTTLPYSETINLTSVKEVKEINFIEVFTDMDVDYTVEVSEDNITFSEWENEEVDVRYIKITANTVNVTGVSPSAYLDDFTVIAKSDKWQEVSTMNTLTNEEIDAMFI